MEKKELQKNGNSNEQKGKDKEFITGQIDELVKKASLARAEFMDYNPRKD